MIIPFPHNSPLLKAAFEVLKGSREGLLVLAPLIVVSRALLNMMTMQGHAQHTKILTDTVLFFIGIYCLESLMTLIMSIPAYASELIANKNPVILDKVPPTFSWFNFTLAIADLVDYLTTLIFHLLSILYLLIMSVAIMLGGYVVFFATLFQVRKVFSVFIMICVFLSLWPFIWYSLDRTFEHVLKVQNENGSSMGTVVSLLVLAIMKVAIPVGGFLASLKAPASLAGSAVHAARSGFSSISKAAGLTRKVALFPTRAIGANEVAKMALRPVGSRLANFGRGAAHTANDLAPFAAYKTSKLIGGSKDHSSFRDFSKANRSSDNGKNTNRKSLFRRGPVSDSKVQTVEASSETGDSPQGKQSKQTKTYKSKRDYIEHDEFHSIKKHVNTNGSGAIDSYSSKVSETQRTANIKNYKTYQKNQSIRETESDGDYL